MAFGGSSIHPVPIPVPRVWYVPAPAIRTKVELRFCLPAALHVHLIEMAKRILTSALQSRAQGPVGTPPPHTHGGFSVVRTPTSSGGPDAIDESWRCGSEPRPWSILQALRKDAEN